jgi:hypothetical protein
MYCPEALDEYPLTGWVRANRSRLKFTRKYVLWGKRFPPLIPEHAILTQDSFSSYFLI